MDTRHLRCFMRIAETGSISRAAESLGLSQPSLSQQLLRLEDEVGHPLFSRSPRGVALTQVGRVFLEHARAILRATETALVDVRDIASDVRGDVTLALPFSISKVAGVALLDAMRTLAPQVSLRLVEATTGQIRAWLEAGKIDIGVMFDVGPLRHLSTLRIAREELYLIGPKGALGHKNNHRCVEFDEVALLPLILPGPQHGLRQIIDAEAAHNNVRLTAHQTLDAIGHTAPIVAIGHGYSILPLSAIREYVRDGAVSLARITPAGIHRTVCLVRSNAKMVTHASVYSEDIFFKVFHDLIDSEAWLATSLEDEPNVLPIEEKMDVQSLLDDAQQ